MTISKLTDLIKDKNSEGKQFLEELTKELRKESLVSTGVLAKELNDVDKNLDQVNTNLQKIFESLTNTSLNTQKNPNKKANEKTINLIQSPDGTIRLADKNPANLKDIFGKFVNPNSRKPDSYMFQSTAQYQQREELRVKLAKKEITQQEFDVENEKIGTTGGLNPANFAKDFLGGLKDTFNFILNRNKELTEKEITNINNKQDIKTDDQTLSIKELITEVIKIKSILEKAPKTTEKKERRQKTEKPVKENLEKEIVKFSQGQMFIMKKIDELGKASKIVPSSALDVIKTQSKAVDLFMSKLSDNQKNNTILATNIKDLNETLKRTNETTEDKTAESSIGLPDSAVVIPGGKSASGPKSAPVPGGKIAGKVLGGARAIGAALPGAAIMAGVGMAIDSSLGSFGVGKMTEEEDEQLTQLDDENWDKMTTSQKIESGLARGVEKAGSFLFLDNIANEARKQRIKNETEYLNKNPNIQSKMNLNNDFEKINLENLNLQKDNTSRVNIVNAPTTITQTQAAPASINTGARARPREEYSDSYTRMYMSQLTA